MGIRQPLFLISHFLSRRSSHAPYRCSHSLLNEALTIEKVVTDFRAVLPEADIYVYDNNSTDGTAEIAKRAGAIVVHEYRQGKGNVIRSMFRDIEADCYVMTDAMIRILPRWRERWQSSYFLTVLIW